MQIRTIVLLAAASSCALAQTGTPAQPSAYEISKMNANNVCRIYFERPKPGDVAGFEQSRKQHFQFHKSQGDTWTWNVYEITTGENMGMYVVSTCGHGWKDLDAWDQKMGEGDTKNANDVMGPHLAMTSGSVYTVRGDMSLADPKAPPAKLVTVSIFHLKPGTADQFAGWVHKMNPLVRNEATRKKNTTWMELSNGGSTPTFVLVTNREGWGELAPPEKANSNRDLGVAAWGQAEYDAGFKQFSDAIASVNTEAAIYRPDLSYNPR